MAKKIILGVLLAGLVGLLVWGGVNRTLARTEETPRGGQSESLYGGNGQGLSEQANEIDAGLGGQGFGASAGQDGEQAAFPQNATGRGQGGQGIGAGTGQGSDQAASPLNASGQGQGGQGGGAGSGGQGQGGQGTGGGARGAGGQSGLAESGGYPQVEVAEWVTLQGTVESVSVDEALIAASTGETIILDGRAWSFAQEAGFSIQTGEEVSLTGFYEEGEFEIGLVEDLTSGQSIQLREQSGRPAWAGNGRWNK